MKIQAIYYTPDSINHGSDSNVRVNSRDSAEGTENSSISRGRNSYEELFKQFPVRKKMYAEYTQKIITLFLPFSYLILSFVHIRYLVTFF